MLCPMSEICKIDNSGFLNVNKTDCRLQGHPPLGDLNSTDSFALKVNTKLTDAARRASQNAK